MARLELRPLIPVRALKLEADVRQTMATVALACTLVSAIVVSMGAQSPAPAEKTAGEVMKNVQVLKDIPASDLTNTMWFIAGSLGVPCQHCHVAANDSDAKPAKLTARKMIQMTRDLNAANFGGRPVVTCNTCHQGSLKPNGVPAFWGKDNKTPAEIAAYIKERQPGPAPAAAPAAAPTAAPPPAPPLPSVEAVMASYQKAVGATVVTSLHLSGNLDPDLGPAIHVELYTDLRDKVEMTLSGGAQARQILNGDRGWVVSPAGTIALTPDQLKGIQGVARVMGPVKYAVADAPRTVTGIETIGDRSYFVVESHTAQNRSRLYFDTQSGLLYKSHGDAFTPLGSYPFETIFSDYRDVNGVKLPASMANFGTSGGGRYVFTGIEINVPLDPKRFEPPVVK